MRQASDAEITYAAAVLRDRERYNAIQRDQVRLALHPMTDAEIMMRARTIEARDAAHEQQMAAQRVDDLAAQITARRRGNGRYAVTIAGGTVTYSRQQIETYLAQTVGSRGQDDGHGPLRRAVLVAMDRADAAADQLDATCWLP